MWFWLAFFGTGIFLAAYGNAMLATVERRRMAVAKKRKHSVTGEPLTEITGFYPLAGKVVAITGGVVIVAAMISFALGLEPLF